MYQCQNTECQYKLVANEYPSPEQVLRMAKQSQYFIRLLEGKCPKCLEGKLKEE